MGKGILSWDLKNEKGASHAKSFGRSFKVDGIKRARYGGENDIDIFVKLKGSYYSSSIVNTEKLFEMSLKKIDEKQIMKDFLNHGNKFGFYSKCHWKVPSRRGA